MLLQFSKTKFLHHISEGDPREPRHVHIHGTRIEAKFFLHPQVILAQSAGLDARTLRRLAEVVEERRQDIERAWHEHFR